jgi:hypothetical protein
MLDGEYNEYRQVHYAYSYNFLSSVWTFMFEVTEMNEDFPHCFPNPVILHS